MRFAFLILVSASLLAATIPAGADDRRPTLQATASADSTEVHPDSVFEVTLSLRNPTDAVEHIKIPECAWDRDWKSSNRKVSWDAWDCDDKAETTIEIAPHDTYVFPKTLKMFVDESVKESHLTFRMGFHTSSFGKVIWSNPITLQVVQ